MDKEMEKIAKIMCKHPEVKTCKECGYTCRARADAFKLVKTGYGNIEQAVKEFAEELKQEINDLFVLEYKGKTEKQLYIRKGMEEGLKMAIEITDQLIKKKFGKEVRKE